MNGAERHGTGHLLHVLLVNLVKAGFAGDSPAAAGWREEGSRAQLALRNDPASSSPGDIHLDALWNRAIADAQRDDTVAEDENVKPRLQTTCLFRLDDLASPDFDFDAAAERIRISTATG